MIPELYFFVGKGGVGKSTVAALSALSHARSGRDSLLVSMDPAHNQQDIFCRTFSEKPGWVRPNLMVKQVDPGGWVDTYLKNAQKEIQQVYSYQGAYNLHSCFNILRLSPGLEEYGLILAFEHILESQGHVQSIFFDMPPTALTLRFFSLPGTSLAWLEELLRLRCAIHTKKEIISQIKFGKKVVERDRVKIRLEGMIQSHQKLKASLKDARIHLVINPDHLSPAEALRLSEGLKDLGYGIFRLILNKSEDSNQGIFREIGIETASVQIFPLSPVPLTGLTALDNYLTGQWHPPFRPIRREGPGMPWGCVAGA